MSKLPNAPLLEVVIELRWSIANHKDLLSVQYLYGDIYNELKEKYPYRESIHPIEVPVEATINQPVHRFRAEKQGYPLFQVGPGILTLNTIDSKYIWEDFFDHVKELTQAFLKVYPQQVQLTPAILYLDFFPFNFTANNVHDFINKQFQVKFDQMFFDKRINPSDLNIGFAWSIEEGELMINFQKGINNNREGILLQTRLNGKQSLQPENLNNWLVSAHQLASSLFNRLTEGELYESFK